jgi:hypothetical protein
MSFVTSVYWATIHFPYADACAEQVVVACKANRRNRGACWATVELINKCCLVFGRPPSMLLAVCISIIVVLILYLFYWNRLVAYLIGLFFRLLYWKPSNSRVWVEIGTTSDVSLSAPILTSLQALSISPCWRVGYSSRTCDITPAIRPSKSP